MCHASGALWADRQKRAVPSASRSNQSRDANDPSDALVAKFGYGYGYTDYGATVYTDISPVLSTGGTV